MQVFPAWNLDFVQCGFDSVNKSMIVLMSSCANLPWECNMWTTVRCDYTPPPVLRIFFSSIQGPCFLSGRFKTLTRKAASPKARALGRQAPWERCTGIPKKAFGQRPSPSAGITAAENSKTREKAVPSACWVAWFKKFALFEVCALNLQPFNHSRVSGEMLTT